MVSSSPLLHLPNTYRAFYGSFTALRPFQLEVIEPLLKGRDVILQAATGSGKTEAVLAPCLERVIVSNREEAVLYVVPTRALVHDLRRRLEPLLRERLDLRLGLRTGDVKRLPGGQADLLLTTPESLDVMMGSASREVRAFLQRVTVLIVDEVHQLVQGYRGRHLAYLLRRLEQRASRRLQKVALSATLAGPEAIRESLGLHPQTVWISSAVQRQIQPHVVHLKREPDELIALIDDLALRFGARKLLLFANSRGRCDQLFGWLRQRGYFQQATYLHYSNLKLSQRQEVERQFQRRTQALCIATSTLELGIDIGGVDCVILYDPPGNVTTFLQRLGRASRQSHTTTFWGICRGPRAGEQVLQFLALYQLAQQGIVEAVQPARLPSVLAQQVVSYLYEHKQVSLQDLQRAFPPQAVTLTTLVPAMENRHWLRRLEPDPHSVRWRGGWRYARALKANQIWSNFPETAEPYVLEVEAQAVADLPPTIVRQLEIGDCVDLAGRRIRITDIQSGEHKVVRAVPSLAPDERELYWLGTGPPVSWEVVQTIHTLLQPDKPPDTSLLQGLFTRTRHLLEQQRQQVKRRVVLHNGMELSRNTHGLYRYATYLGSVGNLMLQHTIEDHYASTDKHFSCTSDALAVTCSDRIDFQTLPLPINRDGFQRWARRHLRAVRALFDFNAFCSALPKDLLVHEATDFLWDERLAQAFAHYRQQSSDIASGDPGVLEWSAEQAQEEESSSPTVVGQGPQPAILLQEKCRFGLAAETRPVLPAMPERHQTPRSLTGTMVGSYILHQQCDRLLSFELLPHDQQPPKRALVDQSLGAVRAHQGHEFEQRVLDGLSQQGIPLCRIPERDATGRHLSLRERQDQSIRHLTDLIEQAEIQHDTDTLLGILVQAVLMLPRLVDGELPVDGVGIPDLIEVAIVDTTVVLTIVDVKDSVAPRYDQKWQVAFYAAMLKTWVRHHTFALPVRVAEEGILLTRPDAPDTPPQRHGFTLAPYMESFPFLQQRIAELLGRPVGDASWQLQPRCVSCAYLDICYRQGLSSDDAMLLPHLTAGDYVKLQLAGHPNLADRGAWASTASTSDILPGQQAARLQARGRALVENRVERLAATTSLYPANISAVIMVHLIRDPIRNGLRAWGFQRLVAGGPPEAPQCWVAATEAEISTCQAAFLEQFQTAWQTAVTAQAGPHLVTFGMRSLRQLQEMMASTPAVDALGIVWQGKRSHHTDLRQLLVQHFALPIPLWFTLPMVAQVWGLKSDLPTPPYLFQDETEAFNELWLSEALSLAQVAHLRHALATSLSLQSQIWQCCTSHLQSDWQQTWQRPDAAQDARALPAILAASLDFLDQQQRWREQDILAVQQLPLAERIERYRAIGPLVFEETALDAEGRFLAYFRLRDDDQLSRFREGDFLKLNPAGSPDLQAGTSVILAQYEPHTQRLAVVARHGRLALNPRLTYVLDEDIADWTTPRIAHAVRQALTPGKHPYLSALLAGSLPLQTADAGLPWAQRVLPQFHLNQRQGEALLLPFQRRLVLIEGPPGTGKTHLLACILIALIRHAEQAGRPLRIAVSALTHQAIDNVLHKVQQLLHDEVGLSFPGRCLKWGRRPALADDPADASTLNPVMEADDVLSTSYLILGATGFGLYQLFNSQSGAFPTFFDWVVFDEASQVVIPQALLSLIYGKGQYIFCGDVHQLPPVVQGPLTMADENDVRPERSILSHLLDLYDADVRIRLNETYRLNRELCQLPSRLWYEGDLRSAPGHATSRLALPHIASPNGIDQILDPERPVTLVLTHHRVDHQQSTSEADIIVKLVARLLLDYAIAAKQIAVLAPHRAQNNIIRRRLAALLAQHLESETIALPLIDTVERLQGAERDIVLVSMTSSDPDRIESPFLNNPKRFNVAITRARRKLIVVGSTAFFTHVSHTDEGLEAHRCFAAYYHLCQAHHALFDDSITRLRESSV